MDLERRWFDSNSNRQNLIINNMTMMTLYTKLIIHCPCVYKLIRTSFRNRLTCFIEITQCHVRAQLGLGGLAQRGTVGRSRSLLAPASCWPVDPSLGNNGIVLSFLLDGLEPTCHVPLCHIYAFMLRWNSHCFVDFGLRVAFFPLQHKSNISTKVRIKHDEWGNKQQYKYKG